MIMVDYELFNWNLSSTKIQKNYTHELLDLTENFFPLSFILSKNIINPNKPAWEIAKKLRN